MNKYFFVMLIFLSIVSHANSVTNHTDIKNGSKESTPSGVVIQVNEKDVRVIQHVSKILLSESKWNRKDNRECPDTAKTYSLYCALYKASVEVNGEFDHRLAALEEMRRTVEEFSKGKNYEHRLMGYNNDSSTTFAGIQKVLKTTEARLVRRLKTPQQ